MRHPCSNSIVPPTIKTTSKDRLEQLAADTFDALTKTRPEVTFILDKHLILVYLEGEQMQKEHDIKTACEKAGLTFVRESYYEDEGPEWPEGVTITYSYGDPQ